MRSWDHFEKTRNTCCWTGVILGFVGNMTTMFAPPLGYMMVISALILNLVGAYNWAKLKNRNPAFCLWGFLAPIGFLGLALLKDKWVDPTWQTRATADSIGNR